jgi:Uma2 family endonuclease
MEIIKTLTLDEFMRLYDEEGPFEYIEGERIPMSPTITGHGVIARTLLLALYNHSVPNNLGEPFIELPFVMVESSNRVKGSRVPDLMFFKAERLAAYKASNTDWRDKPFIMVPDLVVEIISPNDRYGDVYEKITRYLADGVQIVWLIDPQQRTVLVYRAASQKKITMSETDILDGADVIPGFRMPVAVLFE